MPHHIPETTEADGHALKTSKDIRWNESPSLSCICHRNERFTDTNITTCGHVGEIEKEL
jgi:hypothetical protein